MHASPPPAAPGPFPELLGADAFAALPRQVRALHSVRGHALYLGRADVVRGRHPAARLCGWLAGLPPAGRDVPLAVDFVAVPGREDWLRDFDGVAMHSRLRAGGGLLRERLGPLAFGFRLHAVPGGLEWTVARVRLLGLLPLPRAWFGGVRCSERERDGRYAFQVRAALPLVGEVVTYEGWLAPADAAQREARGAVVVFDGVCVLCGGWVRFLLRRDRRARLRFAAMQTPVGRALLAGHGLDPEDPATFLVLRDGRALTDGDALAAVLDLLGGRWRLPAALLRRMPRGIRDGAYRLLARNRYRWFGRRRDCLLPAPGQRERFIGTDD